MSVSFKGLAIALVATMALSMSTSAQPSMRISEETWEAPENAPFPEIIRSGFFIENQGDAQLEWRIDVEPIMQPDEAPWWSNWFKIDQMQGFIDPGQVAIVSFGLEPAGLVSGDYDLNLNIIHNDPNQPTVAFNVHAAMTGFPLLKVLPAVASFNEAFEAVEAGREYTMPLRICNDGSDDLEISEIILQSEQFHMDRFEESIIITPGEIHDWMVRFQAAEAGEYEAVITFVSNAPDAPEGGVEIPLRAVIAERERAGGEGGVAVPAKLSITAISPNPFNGVGTIHFQLPNPSVVTFGFYTPDGRLLKVLQQGSITRGEHSLQWDAAGVPSGSYFVKLSTPEGETSLPMTILK